MDYRRYAQGHYARAIWVECIDCGTRDKPVHVWEGAERQVNFAFIINAVMQHEIAAHASNPTLRSKK